MGTNFQKKKKFQLQRFKSSPVCVDIKCSLSTLKPLCNSWLHSNPIISNILCKCNTCSLRLFARTRANTYMNCLRDCIGSTHHLQYQIAYSIDLFIKLPDCLTFDDVIVCFSKKRARDMHR